MEIKKHPPITFDEWLSANKYGDWPQHVEEEVDEIELHQTLQYLGMATMEDIRQKIASKARILFSKNVFIFLFHIQKHRVGNWLLFFSKLLLSFSFFYVIH